jgi:DNA polymerase
MSESAREWIEYFRDLGFDETWQVVPTKTATAPAAAGGAAGTPRAAVKPPVQPSAVGAVGPSAHAAAPAGEDREGRAAALAQLGERARACRGCRLAEGRRQVVFGSGDANAELMFVGEGPGAEEDRQGLPFVGPAGELLTKIIGAIELTREQVYIANVVKCRPPQNRDPLPDEVVACRDYLREQIRLIRPRVIVALGRIAAQSLLGRVGSLASFRGVWHLYEGVPLRVTYHPAALLRDPGYKRPTWEDLKLVRERLREGAAHS